MGSTLGPHSQTEEVNVKWSVHHYIVMLCNEWVMCYNAEV